MSNSEGRDIPRWARELGEERWERLNDLLYDGWDTSDIMRELAIPGSKRRSLEIHARKYGPRRRLVRFAAFKDALLTGAIDLGPKFMRALGLIAANAVSPNVKASTQARACELMNTFARTMAKMMVVDELAEKEREGNEPDGKRIDANEAVRRVLAEYGVRFTAENAESAEVRNGK